MTTTPEGSQQTNDTFTPVVDIPVVATSELPTGSYVRQLYQKIKDSMGLELDAKQFVDAWQWTSQKVFEPCERVYSRVPGQLTEVKKPYLEIRERTRLLALTAVTLAIAGASRRCTAAALRRQPKLPQDCEKRYLRLLRVRPVDRSGGLHPIHAQGSPLMKCSYQ